MKKLLTLAAATLLSISAFAQVNETSSWRFGFTGGAHTSFMHIADIDKDKYPTNKVLFSGIGSVYVQKSFGENLNFAIRPEVAFLNRGGSITDIMRYKKGYYQDNGITDIKYKVKGHYIDLRLPLMYRFGTTTSRVRPYVYLAPILGFTTGGEISREVCLASPANQQTDNLTIKASKANMNPLYFSGAAGVGFDWLLNVGDHVCTLGLEAMYEQGFTNTFGDDNTAENRIPVVDYPNETSTKTGARRYNGIELKLTLGIPFSIFGKSSPKAAKLAEDIEETEIETAEPEERRREDRSCYSLDEINEMMADGESVYGKTICDIEDAVEFDFSESTIRPESYEYLDRLAETLIRTNAHVKVKGHTDSAGSDEFNLNLSRERAISVVNYLKEKGVSPSKLSYDYFGESCPIDTNETPEGRRHNRRVEFEILN